MTARGPVRRSEFVQYVAQSLGEQLQHLQLARGQLFGGQPLGEQTGQGFRQVAPPAVGQPYGLNEFLRPGVFG